MRRTIITRLGVGGGLAALLMLTGTARAQDAQLSQLSQPNYTSGSIYRVGPSVIPGEAYYAGTGYSTINRGQWGVPPTVPQDNSLTRSGIFLTSINYPGIYGAYSYGVTPTFYSYRYGPELYASAAPGTGPTDVVNPVTSSMSTRLQSARIDVQLPGNADLYFNGTRTTQTGASRYFITPPLRPGQDYTYEVRAKWPEGDHSATQTRPVHVKAGDHLKVEFTLEPEESTMMQYRSTTGGR